MTIRKRRQLAANTSESRLKELPEIYTEIPADQAGKTKAAAKIFDSIFKQVRQLLKKRLI